MAPDLIKCSWYCCCLKSRRTPPSTSLCLLWLSSLFCLNFSPIWSLKACMEVPYMLKNYKS